MTRNGYLEKGELQSLIFPMVLYYIQSVLISGYILGRPLQLGSASWRHHNLSGIISKHHYNRYVHPKTVNETYWNGNNLKTKFLSWKKHFNMGLFLHFIIKRQGIMKTFKPLHLLLYKMLDMSVDEVLTNFSYELNVSLNNSSA